MYEKNILNFGKYNGRSFEDVIYNDVNYCIWFLKNLDYDFATNERKQFYDFLKNYFYILNKN